MFHRLENSGHPISSADLDALEANLGVRLPADYAAFLLRHNGGSPTPDGVPVDGWTDGGPILEVRELYHYTPRPLEPEDLLWNVECYAGRMPKGLLPIGANSCGDQICLWITGKDCGKVVLWDHEAEHKPPTTRNIYAVAPSFAAFLERLDEYPD